MKDSPLKVMENDPNDTGDEPPQDDVSEVTVSRPRREHKLPVKFKDFVMK